LRPRRLAVARAIAFLAALLILLASLSAEAKKKKPAKKHKTPAGKVKSKSGAALPPEPEAESDEASSDEKPSTSKAGADSDSDEPAAKAPPPPPPEEEDAPKKPAKAAKAPKEDAASEAGGPIAFRFGVGGRALFRNMVWTDDMVQGGGSALADYSLSPGPMLGLWLEAFPAAFATDGFAANIGVFGRFDYGLGASSKTMAGNTLTTKYQDFLVGLKVRIPFGTFLPYVAGAFGMQKFSLTPVEPATMNTRPNVNYAFISAGGGARIQFTPAIDLDIGAAFLYVTNPGSGAGDVASPPLYPRATANGIDAALSLGFRVTSLIGIRAGVDFRQFGLATRWRSTDTMVLRAGGAVDRNITAWGGLELVFDGVGGGEGEEPAAPKKPPAKAKKPPREIEPDEEPGSED
jgi:hypothetical protein